MLDDSIREVISWRLVTETVRRAPDRLRVYEMHPGGGQYDCLAFYSWNNDLLAFLNRLGRFTPWATLCETGEIRPVSEDAWDIWRAAESSEDPSQIVDGICQRIGASVPDKLPPSTAGVLVYRFIAEFLTWTVCRRSTWQCRSGYLDSSGCLGSRVREELFAPFAEATRRLQCREERDLLDNPAYRFWFILRDSEPVLCLETTGVVWNLSGNAIDLAEAYKGPRRIWPMIYEIAGTLLP